MAQHPPLWRHVEALLFAGVFVYTTWGLAAGLVHYARATAAGQGFIADLLKPFDDGNYHDSVLAVVGLLITLLTLWELLRFFVTQAGKERAAGARAGHGGAAVQGDGARIPAHLFYRAAARPAAAADRDRCVLAAGAVLPAVRVVPRRLPLVQLALCLADVGPVDVDLALRCAQGPRAVVPALATSRAPEPEHDGGLGALLRRRLLLGAGAGAAADGARGRARHAGRAHGVRGHLGNFIHAGERSFRTGRFGPARFFIITPSYHRVHHARNPLYMDTNFCSLLPFWDWMFGTLQPLRDEVKIEYGITRDVDVTSFADFYFGELLLLARDVRRAPDWRTRLAYLVKPPGWAPGDESHTAASARRNFLADHPELRPAGAPALLARLLPRRVLQA